MSARDHHAVRCAPDWSHPKWSICFLRRSGPEGLIRFRSISLVRGKSPGLKPLSLKAIFQGPEGPCSLRSLIDGVKTLAPFPGLRG